MAAINMHDTMPCTALRYVAGTTQSIDDVVSLEVPVPFSYDCTLHTAHGTRRFSGEASLYAFPDMLEELILGHMLLDILPAVHEETLTYQFKKSKALHVIIEAHEKEQEATLPVAQHATMVMSLQSIIDTMQGMLQSAGKWDGTGCFHRAALLHPTHKICIMAEDIGRHNCIDRLKGHYLMHKVPLEASRIDQYFLFITARITASMYAKAYKAGIRTMISRSAITSSAYERAQKDGSTLAAFCRPKEKRVTLFHNGMASIIT